MVSITLLVGAVSPALVVANDAARRSVEITGVHISELPDPTPYLEGGEMLLTTGMPLSGSRDSTRDYITRLAKGGVRALVLGLGPIHNAAPDALTTACAEVAFPLLLVPVQHAFRTVTTGYWELAAKESRAGLVQQIGTQTAVVRAASGAGGAAGVTKLVSQALGTWACCFSFEGAEPVIWPEAAAGVVPALRGELRRFAQRGEVGAATFPLHGYDVIAYPLGGSGRPDGAFVVGTTQRLTKTDRQLMLTAAAALSLRASMHADAQGAAASIDSALAALLVEDEVVAARALAAAAGGRPLPGSVRVFAGAPISNAVRRERARNATVDSSSVLASEIVAELIARGLAAHATRPVSTTVDGCPVVLIDADSARSTRDAPMVHEELTGALSEPVILGGLRATVTAALRTARRAPTGKILLVGDDGALNRGEQAAASLRSYTRAPLVDSVRGYLRHRGSWEHAARELGVHRNTVRSRVRIARATLGIDLDDPDLSAELWIALRDGPRD